MKVLAKSWGKEVVLNSGLRLYWNSKKETMTVDRSCVLEPRRKDPKILKILEKYGHGKVVVNQITEDKLNSIIQWFNS